MHRVALAAVLSLAPAAAAAFAEEPDWAARYHVSFLAAESGAPAARVAAELEWIGKPSERPKWLDVALADDSFPKGYGACVGSFETGAAAVAAPEGRKTAADVLDERTGRRKLVVPSDGKVAFSYTVRLEHDAAGWGPGPDEAPYRFATGAFWTGRSLFLTAKRSKAEVVFSAPAGEKIATSFEPIEGRELAFAVPDETRLRDAFFMVGRFADAELRVGDATVRVALGGALEPSLPSLSAAIGRFLAASGELFGGAPRRRILVCGNVGAEKGSFHGGVFGNDISILVDAPLGPENQGRFGPFLCHEIFHLWNPGPVEFEGQQYWFTEGFTDYYARALLVRLGDLSAADFAEDVRLRAARYLDDRADLSLVEAGEKKFENSTAVYEGGSLAALCLDLEIRAATGNKRSLDDVMRALYRESTGLPLRKRPGTGDIARLASEAAGGRPFGEFFARHVNGREPLPLAESLRHAGLSFSHEVADLPELRSIARTLLRCPSMTEAENGGGVRVFSTLEAPFRENDVIVEVGGRAVRGFDDLRRAFAGREPGSRVAVGVLRDGKPLALDVELGGDPATPPPKSRFVKVTMEPLPGADVLAQAIRKSVFGADGPARAATPQ